MKKLTTSLAVLLLGTALSHAAATGDLILGFQQTQSSATGFGTNLEFDLGSTIALLADAGTGTTVNLSSDINFSDISALYGSNSVNLSTLNFGVATTYGSLSKSQNGVTIPGNTVFVGSGDGTVPQEQTSQTTLRASESGLTSAYNNGNTSPSGIGAEVSTGTAGSYTAVAGADGQYQGNFPFQTQEIYSGAGIETLALYEVSQGSGNGTEFGTLTMNSIDDTLTFTATGASATPEPSTYLLMGVGLAAFAFVARRRMALNA